MKKLFLALTATVAFSAAAHATTIGVTMDKFDDNFLTSVRNAIADEARRKGVTAQFEDAQDDTSQADQPDPEFHRPEGRRHHRQPGRHLGDAEDDRARRRGEDPARLRQPQAGGQDAAAQRRLRRLQREGVGQARRRGARQVPQGQGQHRHHGGSALQQCRARPHGRHRGDRRRQSRHQDRPEADRQLGPQSGARPDEQLDHVGRQDRRRRGEQRRDGDRRDSGAEAGRPGSEEDLHRRHRRHGRRTGRGAERQPLRDRVPELQGPGQGRHRHRAAADQGREGRRPMSTCPSRRSPRTTTRTTSK